MRWGVSEKGEEIKNNFLFMSIKMNGCLVFV